MEYVFMGNINLKSEGMVSKYRVKGIDGLNKYYCCLYTFITVKPIFANKIACSRFSKSEFLIRAHCSLIFIFTQILFLPKK